LEDDLKYNLVILLSLLVSSLAFAQVKVDVELSPAGSFTAETDKITGYAIKTKTGVAAKNVTVDVKSLTTGIELRDKHLKQRLLLKKYPKIEMLKAVGKNGSGKAIIVIKGVKKTYSGKYSINGTKLTAKFDVDLSALGINDVNYMGVGVENKVSVEVTLPIKGK